MYRRTMIKKPLSYFTLVITLITFSSFSNTAHAAILDRTGTMWAPYIEWTLDNPTYSGNPFDLLATTTFVHPTSGETRTTEMFYAGGTSWKFRFTGTRTGIWNFTTASSDAELSEHTGTVAIAANPNPEIRGFLTSQGNNFAKQIGEQGELEPFLFNVHQSVYNGDLDVLALFNDPAPSSTIDNVIDDIIANGGNVVYPGVIKTRFFNINYPNHDNWGLHNSFNPDLDTFAQLDLLITQVHSRSLHAHFWAWGDKTRRQTAIGVGGINGSPDKRVQRYIAARLGPLPGWSMGYGFDLEEWTSNNEVGEWAKYLHDRFGWQHMLWARFLTHPELDALAYNGFGDYLYSDAITRLDSDLSRPHLYTERFLYLRGPHWDMDGTRQKRWQYAMAGGIGSWWGKYWDSTEIYPNPEQLRTHRTFWEKHMRFDYVRDNNLSNGFVLKDISNKHFIAYKENTSAITLDLSNITAPLSVIAIDTKLEYQSIAVGAWGVGNQTWSAPYKSDWAIAIGAFSESVPLLIPSAPTSESMVISDE